MDQRAHRAPRILIQARLGSTRLPHKVLADIGGKRMVERVYDRARLIWPGAWVVVICPANDCPPLASVPIWPYAGVPSEDVLGRYAQWITAGAPIVRLTADCPLLDPAVSRLVLTQFYDQETPWYAGATGAEGLDGLDTEIFSPEALEWADQHTSGKEREHVTPAMRRDPRAQFIRLPGTPYLDWSIDTQEDLDWVREVYACCSDCAEGTPHHTNAHGSIGGTRWQLCLDLHHRPEGDLVECQAADLLQARSGQLCLDPIGER